MAIIVITTIFIYAILITWMWKNLGGIEKTKKLAVIAVGILAIYLITLFLFTISKKGMEYHEIAMEKSIRNILVAIFTGVNSLISLPFLAKQLDKIYEGEIEQKEFLRKLLILVILFVICLSFECNYMKKTQQGILKIYENSLWGKD